MSEVGILGLPVNFFKTWFWDTGAFSKDWETSILFLTPKKSNKSTQENYGAISLVDMVAKTFVLILINRSCMIYPLWFSTNKRW